MLTFTSICLIAVFILRFGGNFKEWKQNQQHPRLAVEVLISSKRTHHTHHYIKGRQIGKGTITYYVTFQLDDGDHIEVKMSEKEYDMLFVGKRGILTFQGTKFFMFDLIEE